MEEQDDWKDYDDPCLESDEEEEYDEWDDHGFSDSEDYYRFKL